ncbi:hypothetical protein FQA39_LY08346 [Lamprigera yunnana]|nr:hypothetical protein FQA39_LY08346 [Lamprigera yunnana]
MDIKHLMVIIIFIIPFAATNLVDTIVTADGIEDEKLNISNSDVVSTILEASETGKCECAVFNTQTPEATDEAILSHTPLDVSCNATGAEICLKLCSVLAEAAKERGPQVLCTLLGHTNNLKASIHNRICGSKEWIYTGITAPYEVCCHEHKIISCSKNGEEQKN